MPSRFEENLEYPGALASLDRVRDAQRNARRYARDFAGLSPLEQLEIIDDERELRLRRLVRSSIFWITIGVPTLLALLSLALWLGAWSILVRQLRQAMP